MPSLKDLKIRIASVKSTRKITKAMQMVAAAKLRRAQEAAEAARPYAERMEAVLGNLASGVGKSASAPEAPRRHRQGGDPPPRRRHRRARPLRRLQLLDRPPRPRPRAPKLLAAGKTVKILTVGKKGREQLRRDMGKLLVGHVDLSAVKQLGYTDAQAIAHDVMHRYNAGEFDVCTIFYNRFQSVISQIPTARQLIPAVFDEDAGAAVAQYEYEPDEEAILAELLPRGVATHIFTALLENGASEQGARMSAMDNATRNAGDMIDRLTIQSTTARARPAITSELIEIISGAEAL